MPTDGLGWPADDIGRRLSAFAERLMVDLDGLAEVRAEPLSEHRIFAVSLIPTRPDAVAVTWLDDGAELQVEIGRNGLGGRWELGRTSKDVDFVEAVVLSVIAGRVAETFGPSRSRVDVTLSVGTVVSETGAQAPRGCIPLPGWTKRGKRVQYAPYRSAARP